MILRDCSSTELSVNDTIENAFASLSAVERFAMVRQSLTLLAASALLLVAPACSSDTGDDGGESDTRVGPDAQGADGGDSGDAGADGDTAGLDVSDAADGETSDGGGELDGGMADADGSSGADGGEQPPCRMDNQCPGYSVCEEGDCRFYRLVQIKDVTREHSSSSQEACDEETGGADLFQLELQGPFGAVRGYAVAADAALTSQENDDAEGVFDGAPNSLTENDDGHMCPSGGFGPNTTLSLGCDGVLGVYFTDGAGNILNLTTGQQLVVHEYGNQCCEGGCPEEYWEVRVCTANRRDSLPQGDRDEEGNFPTCATRVLETGSGRGTVTLQLPR